MKDRKTIIKVANEIQEVLMKLRNQRYLEILNRLAKFVSQFRELGSESKKLGMSLARNWHMAADRCCSRTNRLLIDISYSLTSIRQLSEEPHKKVPKLSLLVEELKQLQQEFDNIDFDKDGNALSVETEPITLDDIYLGPFRIQLELNKLCELYRGSPYYIVALDPHPAGTSEDVTHPHVSNEQLCEGDGSVAIRGALEQGRLCDFFTMIKSILNTYNPDSPYISLADWYGEPCYDCGYVMGQEDTYYCTLCDRDFCEECSTYCRGCDETICLGCAGKCEICEELVCSNCIQSCTECGMSCCESCLEEDMCPNCKEEKETEENEEQQENQGNTNKQNESQPEADNTAVKLAS